MCEYVGIIYLLFFFGRSVKFVYFSYLGKKVFEFLFSRRGTEV